MSTVADYLERDALVKGAYGSWIDEEGVVGVAMNVDESGRNEASVHVEFEPRWRLNYPNSGDAVARDADIGSKRLRTRTVNDRPIADDDIKRHFFIVQVIGR